MKLHNVFWGRHAEQLDTQSRFTKKELASLTRGKLGPRVTLEQKERIRKLRTDTHLTLDEISQITGVCRSTVHRVLRAK